MGDKEEKEEEKEKEHNPGNPYISGELCEAYRETLDTKLQGMEVKLKGLKEDNKKIDGRLWMTLASTIVTILLIIVNIAADKL